MSSYDSYTLSVRDYNSEMSSVRIPIDIVTDANFAAVLIEVAALEAAVDGISAGVIAKRKLTTRDQIVSINKPATSLGQVELKWLVTYYGNATFKKFQCEIPCADITLLTEDSDVLDITAGAGLAFKTAFEAAARSPEINNQEVTVLSVVLAGRNR